MPRTTSFDKLFISVPVMYEIYVDVLRYAYLAALRFQDELDGIEFAVRQSANLSTRAIMLDSGYDQHEQYQYPAGQELLVRPNASSASRTFREKHGALRHIAFDLMEAVRRSKTYFR